MKIFHKIITSFFLFLICSCNSSESMTFIDSFETYPVGTPPNKLWSTAGLGQIVIDNTHAYSGSKSVQLISGEGYQNRAFLELTHLFPIKGNCYQGSLMMYVDNASPDGIHWTMVQSAGQVARANYRAEVRIGGQHKKCLMANYDTQGNTKSDCWQHSKVKIPEKEWFKLSWHFDGPNHKMSLSINQQIIEALSIKGQGEGCVNNDTEGKWIFPIVDKVSLGWVDYQTGGGTRKVWIDDVKLSAINPNDQ